jgi:cytosine/adenosine deaminase-related metal-dependent hydrolase
MDPSVGDFAQADVLVDGKKILAVGPNLHAGGAGEIDARGRIVMPGFIDTHHHQFETALRSFLADGVLINDLSGSPSGSTTYYEYILNKFAPVYRPQDVYISELVGGLSQLDNGVTTVHDVSQIHHSPEHSDAAIKGLIDVARDGYVWFLERTDGRINFVQGVPFVKQNVFTSLDPKTGRLAVEGTGKIDVPTGRMYNLPIMLDLLCRFL